MRHLDIQYTSLLLPTESRRQKKWQWNIVQLWRHECGQIHSPSLYREQHLGSSGSWSLTWTINKWWDVGFPSSISHRNVLVKDHETPSWRAEKRNQEWDLCEVTEDRKNKWGSYKLLQQKMMNALCEGTSSKKDDYLTLKAMFLFDVRIIYTCPLLQWYYC